MSGENNLDRLLQGMSAELQPGVFVFVTIRDGCVPEGVTPRMIFAETEGTTLILPQDEVKAAGLEAEFPCRMITLNVHSALDAVGFLARITTALAARNMGVNPVSGFFHDHLFVPEDRADDAMQVLHALSAADL
ncbi:ACT domain-containing protein [uncultured Roseobacter sp.]|uniref:ACT domain-containing protein n=1 Tax=uncultured Roseobacter sp. TaxID=114847 RepID=UPI00262E143F|nr:ACT domain-containing protein [uncultured Roseobacter sp.]